MELRHENQLLRSQLNHTQLFQKEIADMSYSFIKRPEPQLIITQTPTQPKTKQKQKRSSWQPRTIYSTWPIFIYLVRTRTRISWGIIILNYNDRRRSCSKVIQGVEKREKLKFHLPRGMDITVASYSLIWFDIYWSCYKIARRSTYSLNYS